MGYIKLDRNILNWEWYGDINTCRLFIHMIVKANWEESRFQGKIVPRGSFVSSFQKLSNETNITVREVRTAINHLKKTGEVTYKSYSKYSVFTVKNYSQYQQNDTQSDKQVTSKRQPKKEGASAPRKNFVPPTAEEVKAYCLERNNSVDYQSFVNFYESKGWMVGKNRMKDWKAAVRTWEKSEKDKKPIGRTNKFNQFKQNDYDFDALEKELLSN